MSIAIASRCLTFLVCYLHSDQICEGVEVMLTYSDSKIQSDQEESSGVSEAVCKVRRNIELLVEKTTCNLSKVQVALDKP